MAESNHEYETRMTAACGFARSAGAVTLEFFRRSDLAVEHKSDGSDVTVADRNAEAHLRELIAAVYPDDAILGEEFGEEHGEEHGEDSGTSGWRWILDPIDGTKSFVHGVPLYGTLVGLEHHGVPVLGVIHMPALDEMVWGGPALGAFSCCGNKPPQPARVSPTASLDCAMVCTTAPEYFITAGRRDALSILEERAAHMRGWSDCYAHLLLATGRIDAVVEPLLAPWDIAAVIPIIQAAGGRATDWNGDETYYATTALTSNGRIHDELVTALESGSG